MEINHSKLQEVFRSAFDNSNLDITSDSKRDDIEEWDSINHLNLIVELEDAFNVKFTVSEIECMDSVPSIISILKTKDN